MVIIPAIDIKNGQCVRLAQGDFDRVTVYADNPVDMALAWAQRGAELIHIVDLDGSVAGLPRNEGIILDIAKKVNIPVQVGGGIRNMKTIDHYLENGVAGVILVPLPYIMKNLSVRPEKSIRGKLYWALTL